MSFVIERLTTTSVEETLHAIERAAPYWQEPLVPQTLRERGAFGVRAVVKGRRFRLFVYDMGRRPPASFTDMKGYVEVAPGGGARVVARVGLRWSSRWWNAALAALVAWCLGNRSWGAALGIAGFLAVGVVSDRAFDRGITPEGDEGARHLVDRLDSALSPQPSAASSHSAV